MSLTVRVKYMDGLVGKGERMIKGTFRESKQRTRIAEGRDSVFFGQDFQWPVSRPLDDKDTLILQAYTVRKRLPSSLLGTVKVNLYSLTREPVMNLRENLVDGSNRATSMVLTFELHYQSPDSTSAGTWESGMINPITPLEYGFEDYPAKDTMEDMEAGFSAFPDEQDLDADRLIREEYDLEQPEDTKIPTQEYRDPRLQKMLQPTVYGAEPFQLAVNVVEARRLVGTNINPMIAVSVGKAVQKTPTKYSTNRPYYDNYFSFDVQLRRQQFLSETIRIRVYNMRANPMLRLLPGKLIGEFVTDVQTVYDYKGHSIFNKWALIIDPKDPWAGPCGFVKVDMSVVERGQEVKRTKREKSDQDENIEANLILPRYLHGHRQDRMVSMSVHVYQAEDLPPMHTDISNQFRQAFVGEGAANVDPYVEVTYAGFTAKTKTQKYNANPIWNQGLVFNNYFPPLTHTLRVNVRNSGIKGELIATHVINLKHIMLQGASGFLPTFGPSWINLYGTPRIYTYAQMLRPEDELNMGLGEGVAFRGRLLLAIDSKEDETIEKVGTAIAVANPVSETVAGKKNIYFLFGSIFDATVIDKALGSKNKPISFEMSIGVFGNKLDGKRGGIEDIPIEFAKSDDRRERVDWNESTTEPMLPRSEHKEYYYLDFQGHKPNMYLISYFEDHRSRMCIPNILERLRDYLQYGLDRFRFLIMRRENRMARRYFRHFMRRLEKHLLLVVQDVNGCRGTASRTKLDVEYAHRVRRDLKHLSVEVVRLTTIHGRDLGWMARELNGIIRHVEELMETPQDALPDVFISMIMDGQRVGFARIPAREIYYSVVDSERGKWNGQITTVYIRKQGREGVGEKGWKIQCQLKIFLWLSLLKDYTTFYQYIPSGVRRDCLERGRPPNALVYDKSSMFELRCYIFIGRNLIASDDTGLSDPLARVIIKEHVLETQPLYQTMSPMWDVLLHKQIVFHQDPESVKKTLQQVVVEVFDVDPGNELEFLGRCFCEAQVFIDRDQYKPPRLQWWPIFRGQTPAGELLAAFDLIQLNTKVPFEGLPTFTELAAYTKDFDNRVILKSIPGMVLEDEDDLNRESSDEDDEDESDDDDMFLDVDTIVTGASKREGKRGKHRTVKLGLAPPPLAIKRREEDYRIPDSIRPPLQRFRVEVLFWSMFGMARQHLLPVRHPKVTFEIGGTKIESEIIDDLKKRILFRNHLKVIDVYLPEDTRYWPPMVMTCHDNRTFGTRVMVGTYTFTNINEYLQMKTDDQSDSASTVIVNEGPGLGPSSRLNLGVDFSDITLDDLEPRDRTKSVGSTQAYTETMTDDMDDMDGGFNLADVNPSVAPIGQAGDQIGDGTEKPEVKFDADGKEYLEAAPGAAEQITTAAEPTKEQLDSADWWTRFYATIQGTENYLEEEVFDALTDSDDSELSQRLGEMESEEHPEEEPATTVTDQPNFWSRKKWWKSRGRERKPRTALEKRQMELEKKRNKRVKKKKLRQRIAEQFKGDAKRRYQEEFYDLVYNVDITQDDKSWVDKIQLYPKELEEVLNHKQFCIPFRNIPLYKGKQKEDEESPESRLAGFLKGNMVIYPVGEDEPFPSEMDDLRLYPILPKKSHIKLTVRVYIVRALGLHPADRNGKADPYLVLSLGKVVIDERADYQPKALNPVFGKCYEFNAQLPQDSMLIIQIMDHDRVGSNDLIGETRIDIENRFHSPYRATCGLMQKYHGHGYAKWKDSLLPTEILERICKTRGKSAPVYNLLENTVTVEGKEFRSKTEIKNETGNTIKSVEPLALQVLNNYQMIEPDIHFVKEHVETRDLVHPDRPGLSQGKLQMWVDIFEREVAVPPPAIDISPRQPAKWELRVIVWNTADVILNDTSLFSSEQSSDIYVKGWIKGVGIDDQKTDVHYRSLSGEGNFNWRFIFPFDYIQAEDRVVYPVKGAFDLEPMMVKANCELTLQIWDADLLSADNFLGSITMKLSAMPRCAKTPKSCGLHQLDPDCPKFSVFKNRNVRGWWPCTDTIYERVELQGKVECELELLTAVDAENSPAGQAREEPNALPKPNRPDSSFMKILGPLNTIRYFIKYKLKWILIKILIVVLFLLIIGLFIYSFPGLIARKIVGV
ncbi:Otoferlin [Fasciolopsis buskii]|uniref:Otoferlin n=1 Tax=Fasciolopsis buskii TaxID=27845 RepID=A0A8E0RRX2_9TREM|nr:Otoferlin [Fasciolopsis buski]